MMEAMMDVLKTDWPPHVHLAATLAREHHATDRDALGNPYLWHIERVVAGVVGHGPDAVAVAWLHDLLEDHPKHTPSDLRALGVPDHIVTAVELLTRPLTLTYAQYIDRLKASGNPLALVVKTADLTDHFRPGMPPRLLPRYLKAWATLVGGPPPGQ